MAEPTRSHVRRRPEAPGRRAADAEERNAHEVAACGVLRDFHDDLDRLVAEAYGWPWPMETEEILARLGGLHDEWVEEERRGVVRWLRPEYQVPRFGDRVEAIARRFQGARRVEVEEHPETLKVLGAVGEDGEGKWVLQEAARVP